MFEELASIVLSELEDIVQQHTCDKLYRCEDCILMKERIKQLSIVVKQFSIETQEELPAAQVRQGEVGYGNKQVSNKKD